MPDKTKIVPGPALPLTDEELERLAEITPDDIQRTKALMKQVAPELADILDALAMDMEPKRKGK